MEEKLRPGVFSSYTAGSSGYGSGSRAAGLIVPGVTAPGTPVWVTDGTEAAAALPAPEEAAALAACELLLATGAGKVWLCPVAEEGWQAAFDLAGAEAELDTIVSACEEEADALAFAAMLTAAANDRRERVGIIAAADDEAALALAAAVNCERVMLTAGSGVYQDCDSPLCLAAAVAGKLLSRSAPDESLSAAVLEGLSAVSPARSEAEIETLLRGGVVPAEWVGGQAECIRGVTTRTKNGSAPRQHLAGHHHPAHGGSHHAGGAPDAHRKTAGGALLPAVAGECRLPGDGAAPAEGGGRSARGLE